MKITKHNLVTLLLISFSTIFFSNVWAQCPSNMISYWKLQESTGPDYVDFYGSHDASGPGTSPVQTTGISGKAQLFSKSSSNYLTIDDHTDFDWAGTASFTIELWAKFTGTGTIDVFIGRQPQSNVYWWIGRLSDGKISFELRDNNSISASSTTTGSYNNGQWHHVVAVHNGSLNQNLLYVDAAAPVTTSVTYTGNFSSSADIRLADFNDGSPTNYHFNGSLDEVAIYSRALSAGEITTHYNNARLYQIGYCDGNAPVFLSEPKIYATVGQEYTYDADASGNPLPVYSLLEHPDGMTIGGVTGEISWTPASASANGHVVLRATNSEGYAEQEFNVYIADEPDCRENLVAYWDFDDAGTPYYDNIAGYELTGTAVTPTTGKVGNALLFNGTSDSLNMADPDPGGATPTVFFDLVGSFSIEAWIKTNVTKAVPMVITGRDQNDNNTHYWLGVLSDGSVGFTLRDYIEPTPNFLELSGGSVANNAWHHIVGTYDASLDKMELWVDNSKVDEGTQAFGNFGGSDNLNIGHLEIQGSGDHFWFEGAIDELAFYDDALDATSIAESYNAGNAGDGACVYNYAPIILTSPDEEVDEDSPYYYQISATDIDPGDVLSISAPTKPAWLNFSYTPGETTAVLSATPTNSNVGFHDVLLRVSDGSINVDQDFTIEVINVNDDPYFTSTPVTDATEDQDYIYEVTADDDDVGDDIEITAITIPSWLEFRNDSLIGRPEDPEVGSHPVTLRVSDGTATVDQNFTIEVANTNDAPVITSVPSETAAVGVEYIYHITATDVDEGDVLTFSEVYTPDWLAFDAGNAILSGTATEDDLGENVVILKVNDGTVDVMQNYTIMVSLTALDHHQSDIELLIYPNPANDVIHFEFINNNSKRIMIYDMAGNIQRDILSDEAKKVDVNISDLHQGIYIYRVFTNDQIITGKFTKKQ
ncbi:MAG: T9SS type A sorting domain-containing protein [Bacteroidales bacterium]|nr:T9SS type A sorting domain-containing protein [Bacteroidales bacterium]